MLYYLPLEELDERYTVQMKKWILEDLNAHNIEHTVIEGTPLKNETQGHQFLDWASRVHYATSQVLQVSKLFSNNQIKNGDKFFIPDIWHHGIESLGYMAEMSGIDIELYGIQHAGVFDSTDLIHTLYDFGRYQELMWYKIFKKIFVGSEHLKTKILNGLATITEFEPEIVVTGQVWKPEDLKIEEFEDDGRPIVLWPHRISVDKNIASFNFLVNSIIDVLPNTRFIVTSGRLNQKYSHPPTFEFMTLTKPQYYGLMKKASLVVSTAYHENFGYTIHEATALGTPVLCPNRACYPEMILSKDNIYSDSKVEFHKKVYYHLTGEEPIPVAKLKNYGGFNSMLKHMGLL